MHSSMSDGPFLLIRSFIVELSEKKPFPDSLLNDDDIVRTTSSSSRYKSTLRGYHQAPLWSVVRNRGTKVEKSVGQLKAN